MKDAELIIRNLEKIHPNAVRLAELVSIAVTVEPELLRAARLTFVKEATAGDEADLWFSNLVRTSNPIGFTFFPEIAKKLRERLVKKPVLLNEVWDKLYKKIHSHISPIIFLEEEIIWRYLKNPDDPLIEQLLRKALISMITSGDNYFSYWTLRAVPNFPEHVSRREIARMLNMGADLRIGGPHVISKHYPEELFAWAPMLLPDKIKTVRVGIKFSNDEVGFGDYSSDDVNFIEMPDTNPIIFEVSWKEKQNYHHKEVYIRKGEYVFLVIGSSNITLKTLSGDKYKLYKNYDNFININNNTELIFKNFFNKFDNDAIDDLKIKYVYPDYPWFQDRKGIIDSMNNFMISNKPIFFLQGKAKIGKTTFIWYSLSRKIRHERLPIYIKLNRGYNLVTIIQEIVLTLDQVSHYDMSFLSDLKNINSDKLKDLIAKYIIQKMSSNTLLILDNLENVLDPENKIVNKDIEWFIDEWSNANRAKIIIASRLNVSKYPRGDSGYRGTIKELPKNDNDPYFYVKNCLNSIVPTKYREKYKGEFGYPQQILRMTHNHPYIIYTIGMLIANCHDENCLNDPEFIRDIELKLYSKLIMKFDLSNKEIELLFALTLLEEPFPKDMVSYISNTDTANKMITMGVLVECSPGRYEPLKIFSDSRVYLENNLINFNKQDWYKKFIDAYNGLYKTYLDPRYYWQAGVLKTLLNPVDAIDSSIPELNVHELSQCVDTWYKQGDYKNVLLALNQISKKDDLSPVQRMTRASCLIRLDNIRLSDDEKIRFQDGVTEYNTLFKEYGLWQEARYSYVKSLLYTRCHPQSALDFLMGKNNLPDRDYVWMIHVARSYLQLLNIPEMYKFYEAAIENYYKNTYNLSAPMAQIWPIIHEVIIVALGFNHMDMAEKWLEKAINSDDFDRDAVKIDYGIYYEFKGEYKRAKQYLWEAYESELSNAYCIFPLIRVMCKLNEFNEANIVLNESNRDDKNILPIVLLKYANIYYLKSVNEYHRAIFEFKKLNITPTLYNKYQLDLLQRWLWTSIHHTWCKSELLTDDNKIKIARDGLWYANDIIMHCNYHLLYKCKDLAEIANQPKLLKKINDCIKKIEYKSNVL